MPEKPIARFFLLPFSYLYGAVIFVRNYLYDKGFYKSIEFDFPVICIGNLTVGGTGKTPHVEYLIKLLSGKFQIGILSRGYKRNSRGYREVHTNSSTAEAGDEPVMLKKKYPHVAVAVSEDRATGIPQMLSQYQGLNAIILDDAFQHRMVHAGLNILLTAYDDLYTRDELLPAGTLREFKSGSKRADFIVVTKCPENISEKEKKDIRKEIAPHPNQLIFFSYQLYGKPYLITDGNVKLEFRKTNNVLLFTGIAEPASLEAYLKKQVANVFSLEFSDHHLYDRFDIERITEAFQNIDKPEKLLITTEKDAVRLQPFAKWIVEKKLPIFVVPLSVEFFKEDKKLFDSEIIGYLEKLAQLKNISQA